MEHCNRLTNGFRKVLTRKNGPDGPLPAAEINDLAHYAMISMQGLWSYSRLTDDAAVLRAHPDTLVASLAARLRRGPH